MDQSFSSQLLDMYSVRYNWLTWPVLTHLVSQIQLGDGGSVAYFTQTDEVQVIDPANQQTCTYTDDYIPAGYLDVNG